ncbi:MAG: methyltransferase domain-containing protein [bacterium]|nr:methyltransferase domain-containing protein [bacterium]
MSAEKIRPSIDQDKEMVAKNIELEKLYGGYFGNPENCAPFIEHLPQDLFSNKTPVILDAGSSQGVVGEYVSNEFIKRGSTPRLILMDTNDAALKKSFVATEKIVADLKNIPLGDSSINLALLRSVLHYESDIGEQKKILRELYRVLSSEGVLVSQFASFDNEETANAFNRMFKFLKRNVGFVSKESGIKMHEEVFGTIYKVSSAASLNESITEFGQRVGRDEIKRAKQYIEEHIGELSGILTNDNPFAWKIPFTIVSCKKEGI